MLVHTGPGQGAARGIKDIQQDRPVGGRAHCRKGSIRSSRGRAGALQEGINTIGLWAGRCKKDSIRSGCGQAGALLGRIIWAHCSGALCRPLPGRIVAPCSGATAPPCPRRQTARQTAAPCPRRQAGAADCRPAQGVPDPSPGVPCPLFSGGFFLDVSPGPGEGLPGAQPKPLPRFSLRKTQRMPQ